MLHSHLISRSLVTWLYQAVGEMYKWDVSTNLLRSPPLSLVLCNLNPSLPEMTLKEWAMLFHTPRLYACCSYWKAWANSFACLCVCKCVLGGFSHVLLFVTLSTRLLCPWDFPAKNTGVGCHAFFQGILPTQGSNLCLLLLVNRSVCLSRWNGCLNCVTVMSLIRAQQLHTVGALEISVEWTVLSGLILSY